ncbi:MAG: hypothetical protein QOG86_1704 [Thermoleophilaceae bacterium]|jgi:aminoglycoside phosphotransferase (APT) family kinase protein|nr:hypothetical protein [Thermoleophilaceae bacterium]
MHEGEVYADASLVRRLLAAQAPRWAALPLTPVASAGTSNAVYRLGDDLAVRLPRHPGAAGQVGKEHRWLPGLAPYLPLPIPLPVARGVPGEGYPWPWSVCRWLDGENATLDRLAAPYAAAVDLAAFVTALRGVDATGGPPPGEHNFGRGAPLAQRDGSVRDALAALDGPVDGAVDTAAIRVEWDTALRAPVWDGAPVWVHGDLSPGNLLARDGRLSAVIDFGGLGVGDPACDLLVAWSLFGAEARQEFRDALGVDDASWARGRGWALSVAVIALPYYLRTNPMIVRDSRHTIAAVLADAAG